MEKEDLEALLLHAKALCSEGIHRTPMRKTWHEDCVAFIKLVEEME